MCHLIQLEIELEQRNDGISRYIIHNTPRRAHPLILMERAAAENATPYDKERICSHSVTCKASTAKSTHSGKAENANSQLKNAAWAGGWRRRFFGFFGCLSTAELKRVFCAKDRLGIEKGRNVSSWHFCRPPPQTPRVCARERTSLCVTYMLGKKRGISSERAAWPEIVLHKRALLL